MKSKQNRERAMGDALLGIMFLICVVVLNCAGLLKKDKKISESENRFLAERPEFTIEGVVRGSFGDNLEAYLSDQFIFRDGFRTIHTGLKLAGGSRLQNNIFYGKNGQLMKNIDKPDREVLSGTVEAINSLAEYVKGTDEKAIYMMLVPDVAAIYPELLPSYAQIEDEETYFQEVRAGLAENVTWIDGISVMRKYKKEKIYYKTDHHWTTRGAYHMFEETAETFELDAEKETDYDIYPIATDFNGVLSGNSGFAAHERDEIDVYLPKVQTDVIVNYVDEQKKKSSLYDVNKLAAKDKYGVFLGGNSSLIDIRTTAESDRSILIIKDSFANCYIPFLVPYYREIVVVDPRYYAGTVAEVLEDYRIDDILFLYSGNTFLTDNHIAGFMTI